MPFFLLLDSFELSVDAGVVVPSALVVEVAFAGGGAAAAALLSMGVSGVTTPVPVLPVVALLAGLPQSVKQVRPKNRSVPCGLCRNS